MSPQQHSQTSHNSHDQVTDLENRALELEQKGQFQAALNLYQAALKRIPEEAYLHRKAGLMLTYLGKYVQAESYLLSAQERPQETLSHEQQAEALEALATCQLELGKFKAAIVQLKQLEQLEPQQAMPCILQALAYEGLESFQTAIEYYQKALQKESATQAPEQTAQQAAQIWHNLGTLHHKLGKHNDAQAAFKQALALNRHQVETHMNFRLLEEHGNSFATEIHTQIQFLLEHPEHSNRTHLLCRISGLLGNSAKPILALKAFYLAFKTNANAIKPYLQLGAFLLNENQDAYAWAIYFKAFYRTEHLSEESLTLSISEQQQTLQEISQNLDVINPDKPEYAVFFRRLNLSLDSPENISTKIPADLSRLWDTLTTEKDLKGSLDSDQLKIITGLAGVLAKQKHVSEAYELIHLLINSGIDNPDLGLQYAGVCAALKKYQEPQPYLEQLMKDPNLSQDSLKTLLFQQGKLYDQRGLAAQAFEHFKQANQLKQKQFKPAQVIQETETLLQLFDRTLLEHLPRGNTTDKVIFIVGMPRSGTTLTEQILCSHSQIHGAGEVNFLLTAFYDLIGSTALNASDIRNQLQSLPVSAFQNSADTYLHTLQSIAPKGHTGSITNKMPSNFRLLGLIEVLFPNAIVFHCNRHPLDTCLSCFSLDFLHLNFTNSLENIGLYYQQYQRYMAHWKKTLSIPVIDVYYEDLVTAPERASKQLIQACKLDWEESCLSFHKNTRHVRTASANQVSQPIYTSSMHRYQKYQQYLEPLLQWIELPERYQ